MMNPTFSVLALLAQAADGPARPGSAPVAPAAPAGAEGAATAANGAAAPATGPAGGSGFLIMMMVLLGTMVLFSVMSGRREKKKRAELLGSIKKHDKVTGLKIGDAYIQRITGLDFYRSAGTQ